jgi:ATP-dependent Lhr-like helicase
MRSVLEDDDQPAYLDAQAKQSLAEARAAYRDLHLDVSDVFGVGRDTFLMTWHGTEVNGLLSVLVRSAGFDCEIEDAGVAVSGCTASELMDNLAKVAECPPLEDLSGFVDNVRGAKLDELIEELLLRRPWCRRNEPVLPRLNRPVEALRLAAEGAGG